MVKGDQRASKNRYVQIIEKLFEKHYHKGDREVPFERSEIEGIAGKLGIELPKNLGDLLYSFRYRAALPASITAKAPEGYEWIIRPAGRARYKFVLTKAASFAPNASLARIKIPDATPGLVSTYALDDEQALLAKIRYNRLVDIFTGVTCYSLQNHLRTTLKDVGQVETDEIYIGVDRQDIHYVLPVQAKTSDERLGIVQIEQDYAICATKFPGAVARPLAAQFTGDDGIRVRTEKHYWLVDPGQLSSSELEEYRKTMT